MVSALTQKFDVLGFSYFHLLDDLSGFRFVLTEQVFDNGPPSILFSPNNFERLVKQ